VKSVYGTGRTLHNLSRIFDGGVWPALASWQNEEPGHAYVYRTIETADNCQPISPISGMSFSAHTISHGSIGHDEDYDSTVFFIQAESGAQFLFFGDVAPDSLSRRPGNRAVWRKAAASIAAGNLSTIFIECSFPSRQQPAYLYGHLSPPFLFEELKVLAGELKALQEVPSNGRKPLEGITLCITHIKERSDWSVKMTDESAQEMISRELTEMEAREQLGVKFVIVEQGMRIEL